MPLEDRTSSQRECRSKADERETLLDPFAAESGLVTARPSQMLIGDKNYFGRGFAHELAEQDIRL